MTIVGGDKISSFNNEDSFNFVFMRLSKKDIEKISLGTDNFISKKGILTDYYNISEQDYGFIFKLYFWLLIGVSLISYHIIRLSRVSNTYPALALIISGFIYVMTYLPASTYHEYRFVYWSVLSFSIASSIFMAEYYRSKNNLRSVISQDKTR